MKHPENVLDRFLGVGEFLPESDIVGHIFVDGVVEIKL